MLDDCDASLSMLEPLDHESRGVDLAQAAREQSACDEHGAQTASLLGTALYWRGCVRAYRLELELATVRALLRPAASSTRVQLQLYTHPRTRRLHPGAAYDLAVPPSCPPHRTTLCVVWLAQLDLQRAQALLPRSARAEDAATRCERALALFWPHSRAESTSSVIAALGRRE